MKFFVGQMYVPLRETSWCGFDMGGIGVQMDTCANVVQQVAGIRGNLGQHLRGHVRLSGARGEPSRRRATLLACRTGINAFELQSQVCHIFSHKHSSDDKEKLHQTKMEKK